MTEQEKLEKEQKELDTLIKKSPYVLPDNPSASGWTSSQIKAKFTEGFVYLYSLLKEKENNLNDEIDSLEKNKADKTEIPTKLSQLEKDVELGAVISLGEIGYPGVVNNEKLNAVTNSGVYTFTSTENYSGGYFVNANVYFMVVERTDTDDRAVEQFIYSCDVPRDSTNTLSNLSIIRRIKSKNTGTWVVNSIAIPSQEYVDKKIAKLISEEIDSSPETLNTLKELADALKENEDVVEALNNAIGNKADKKDIPTKLSQLEQDIKLDLNNYYQKSESDNKYVSKTGNDNIYGVKTFYTLPEVVYTPTKDNQLASKKYVDYKVSEKDNYTYQAQVDGGTYPRIMKYDDDTLYLFTDNAYSVAYSVSKDGGRTWGERTVICSTILDSTDEIPVDDVANAFGILSPNNDGRVIVFYRAVNRDTSYFSIRCRVSDTTGHNFGEYQILKTNDTGVWEPFYYEGYLYYSWEHERLGAQSQYRSKITVNGGDVSIGDGKMAVDGRKSQNIDGNTINTSRVGMLSIAPLKDFGHIFVYENTVNKNASVPRPMVVQYAYGKTPEDDTIGLTKKGTLFIGDEGITMGAPYVTTLDDGRVVISFQTDQFYEGITTENKLREKQVVVYVSKRIVNYGDELTADDFVRLNNYSYGENDYSVWGCVQNIDGRLFNVFTLGKNKNENERLFATNIVKELNPEIVVPVDKDSANAGGSSGGDSVKVADMIVNVNDDMGSVSLSIENCPSIDFYKSFRIEIYDNNQLKEDWVFTAFDTYFEALEQTVLCQDIINQTLDIYVNMFDIFSLMALSNEENNCFCEINFYQSYLENLSNLTAKIYYYEADKTTRYFYCEL